MATLMSTDGQTQHGSGGYRGDFLGGIGGGVFFKNFETLKNRSNDV